jgi:acetylserotonin N-methyltransferase
VGAERYLTIWLCHVLVRLKLYKGVAAPPVIPIIGTSMLPDLTAAPATDPLPAYRYRDGLYAVDLVAAALHVDFFTWLSAHPATPEAIARHFGFRERPLDVMLTLFLANGWLLRDQSGAVSISRTGEEHLCAHSPWFLGPYYASLHDRPIARDFLEVLKTGKPAGWSGDKASFDWHKAMEQEDFARRFTAAMDCRGVYLAQALAKKLDLSGRVRLLDVGAGSGIYACSIAAHHPHLKAIAFDQSPVDRIAHKLIDERGCAERVSVAAGNMFEGLPEGCDVHLYSNVLHDWDVAEVKQLLAASHATLPPGGLLIIHDAFINAAKDGPLHVAEYSCLLMHSTQGKCYSVSEYAELLQSVGFDPGAYQATVVGRGFMTALRR